MMLAEPDHATAAPAFHAAIAPRIEHDDDQRFHAMIDIETLGTEPGSVILSIGAVAFMKGSTSPGVTLYRTIRISSCKAVGLTVDARTARWWDEQTEEARDAAFMGERSIHTTLEELSAFLSELKPDYVWARGPQFDLVLLEAAYKAAGFSKVPWRYSQVRDSRTFLDLIGIDPRTFSRPADCHHNALSDASVEALAVAAGIRKLDTMKDAARARG